ncbi:hypothetical protein AWC19_02700 [Mycobacterium palustre]|uniref:Uncharacterized protein n=1 Tax=Mycobacterium palustre TaxID=153971 RepID=A0A1X1ZUW1_9MYCO|nr:hypothetical protein AWC19_02700 [Mycobacterium palustre]
MATCPAGTTDICGGESAGAADPTIARKDAARASRAARATGQRCISTCATHTANAKQPGVAAGAASATGTCGQTCG